VTLAPYYQDEFATVYLGDCNEVTLEFGAQTFDAMIADPPYGATSLEWDKVDLGWLSAATRVVDTSGSIWCFGNLRFLVQVIRSAEEQGWRVAQDIVWEKHNGSGFTTDRFRRVHEQAVQLYRKFRPWEEVYRATPLSTELVKKKNMHKQAGLPQHFHGDEEKLPEFAERTRKNQIMTSVFCVYSCNGSAAHPTQKPTNVLKPLLRYSVPGGGLVLDPTTGSGSTLVAAKALGMRSVGIEINERYCEIAARRLRVTEVEE